MDTATQAYLDDLINRDKISRVINAYARLIDTKDFAGWAAQFTEDGKIQTPGGEEKGRQNLEKFIRHDLGQYYATQHVSSGHEIWIDGNSAKARSTLLATHALEDQTKFWTIAGYYDLELRKVDEQWFFYSVALKPAWIYFSSDDETLHTLAKSALG